MTDYEKFLEIIKSGTFIIDVVTKGVQILEVSEQEACDQYRIEVEIEALEHVWELIYIEGKSPQDALRETINKLKKEIQ